MRERICRLTWLVACVCGSGSVGAQVFPNGAVATDHVIASEAGAEMLRAGGNAVDAAVAASLALSVVRPMSCGIGGGGFMVVYLAPTPERGAVETAICYRETAPAGVDAGFYERLAQTGRADASTRGGAAVAVPGTVAGLLYALERYGTLDRETVLRPAIRAAEEGFEADAAYVDATGGLIDEFRRCPEWRERFAFVWDRFLNGGEVAVGTRIVLPEQARVLAGIAAQGRAGFYNGPVAEAIVRAVEADGGVLTLADLAHPRVEESAPVRFAGVFGGTVLTMPTPSSGGLILGEIFGAQGCGFPRRIDVAHNSPAYVHRLTEGFKHAFADRARFLYDMPRGEYDALVHRLTLGSEPLRRLDTFDPDATYPPEHYGAPVGFEEDGGTSHISVVDRWGNAVACTETINLTFGSLVSPAGLGFCLNNEMDDFTTRVGEANAFGLRQSERNLPAPGRRPLSSMTPTIVLREGGVHLVAGAAGGPKIITATAQAIANVMRFDMSAAEALAAPRFHHQWQPDTLVLEDPLAGTDLERALRAKGHRTSAARALATVNLIRRSADGDGWEAASDPRRSGAPAGH